MTTLLVTLMFACTSSTPDPVVEETPTKTFNAVDINELAAAVDKAELVPSPLEMEQKLQSAGLQKELGALVTTKDISVIVDDLDQVAIRTGVVMSDLVLTLKTSESKDILHNLGKMKAGLAKLGAGSDIDATIGDFEQRIGDAEVKRSELLTEFDELSQVMVSELEYEAGEWVVPLIQAGTWLEGANLVSQAMIQEGKFDAADEFFRQKEIVEYFISYIDREGKDRAPDGIVTKLLETLNTLKAISGKPKLDESDVKEINKLTTLVLNLL